MIHSSSVRLSSLYTCGSATPLLSGRFKAQRSETVGSPFLSRNPSTRGSRLCAHI